MIPVTAVNPHTSGNTGQPDQSCQDCFGDAGPFFPQGFNTEGFDFATTMYAGSGHTLNGGNPHAVSQYDVACFQQLQRLNPN